MAKHPRKIGSIVNQLMARRGYAQVQSASEMEAIFLKVLGNPLSKACTPGHVKRGTLDVAVTDSVVVQELSFQKRQLLKALQKEFPQTGITDIRFRVS